MEGDGATKTMETDTGTDTHPGQGDSGLRGHQGGRWAPPRPLQDPRHCQTPWNESRAAPRDPQHHWTARAGGQQGGSWAPPTHPQDPQIHRTPSPPHPQTVKAPSQTGIPGAAATWAGSLCPQHWPGVPIFVGHWLEAPCVPHTSSQPWDPVWPPMSPQCREASGLTWGVVAQPHAAGATDAQVGHGGGQVGGAAAPAQGGIRGLLGVQGGGQGGWEVQRGQVGQGPPRVEGRGHEGHVGRLIRGWEYAEGRGRDRIRAGAGLPPPDPQNIPLPSSSRSPVPTCFQTPPPHPKQALPDLQPLPGILHPIPAPPSTHWIPGTSQERGRAEEDESCGIKVQE